MSVYEIASGRFVALGESTFPELGIKERSDLQRYLSGNISVIAPDCLVLATEFGQWENSQRHIDILALDRLANLVVIELKRTEDGGHMELQALRYAAMVSKMTFEQAVDAFAQFLKSNRNDEDPKKTILDFLGWEDESEQEFGQEVRVVLASAGFSPEITSSVLWLRDYGIDIRCVRLKPYKLDDTRVLVDVQEIIPLPDEADFQIQIQAQEKRLERKRVRQSRDGTIGATVRSVAVEVLRARPSGLTQGPLSKAALEFVRANPNGLWQEGLSKDTAARIVGFSEKDVTNHTWKLGKEYHLAEVERIGDLFQIKSNSNING